MKKILSLGIALFALLTMAACNSNKNQGTANEAKPDKALVLYYSQTGATKAVAEQLKSLLNADIEAIEIEEPYSGTYEETIARIMQERANNVVPAVKPLQSNLDDYEVIYLGYPIWFGTYAPPIAALVDTCDFDGKKIVTFCTFGSGGLEASSADLKASLPKADVVEGYGVRNARINAVADELPYFLISNGYIEGEVETLPDYSQQEAVTPEEAAIFEAACGDYQFPLGTPVTVGKRTTPNSTDYKYVVNSKDMQGNDVEGVIFVTVGNEEGAKPEFTRVVR